MTPTNLVSLPSATQVLAGVATTSDPMFQSLLPIGLFITGFLVAALLLLWLMGGVSDAFHNFVERRRERRWMDEHGL